jgi:hypothetical protein
VGPVLEWRGLTYGFAIASVGGFAAALVLLATRGTLEYRGGRSVPVVQAGPVEDRAVAAREADRSGN